MELLVRYSELTPQELRMREDMRRQLESAFRRIFRKCAVRVYGSTVNTFGVRGSDIDSFLELYMDTEEAQAEIPVSCCDNCMVPFTSSERFWLLNSQNRTKNADKN